MIFFRSVPIFVLLAWLASGCASNPLDGPIYDASGPGWVKPAFASSAGEAGRIDDGFELEYRMVLIGDAGLFLESDPTLAALGSWSREAPSASVVFMGDNVYNEGLVEDDRERGELVLAQMLASTGAHKIFIPGNHDWGFSPKGQNRQAILNQQTFIDQWNSETSEKSAEDRAEFLPRDGCMGPRKRVLYRAGPGRRDVVLIALDPTPWINPRLRDACPTPETKQGFLDELDRMLAAHAEDFVVVSSHYPMRTGGPHGGLTYGAVGDAITGLLGWAWGGLMNTYEPTYADWIAQTQDVFRRHPPLVYAAGHDHNLQLLDGEDFVRLEIVSGAGARDRVSTVTSIEPTIYAHAVEGFVVLDLGVRSGEEVVVVRVIETDQPRPAFEMEIP